AGPDAKRPESLLQVSPLPSRTPWGSCASPEGWTCLSYFRADCISPQTMSRAPEDDSGLGGLAGIGGFGRMTSDVGTCSLKRVSLCSRPGRLRRPGIFSPEATGCGSGKVGRAEL